VGWPYSKEGAFQNGQKNCSPMKHFLSGTELLIDLRGTPTRPVRRNYYLYNIHVAALPGWW
jgi:hypothetical protein